jgi:3-hydroxyisobutyrate dehydrogenase-like beta-hydroxyacid dehydrogenase
MNVGFIGVGLTGRPMAPRLARPGQSGVACTMVVDASDLDSAT